MAGGQWDGPQCYYVDPAAVPANKAGYCAPDAILPSPTCGFAKYESFAFGGTFASRYLISGYKRAPTILDSANGYSAVCAWLRCCVLCGPVALLATVAPCPCSASPCLASRRVAESRLRYCKRIRAGPPAPVLRA